MANDFTAVFEPPVTEVPELDELVRGTMTWHFSPDTGSPYWTGRLGELDFDPISDIKTFDDLRLFADVSVDWSRISADQLIPVGCRADRERFGVYESGGTTGPPKRIVDACSRRRNVEWHSTLLDQQGFPSGFGNWLHVGPTGPHIMAKNVTHLAALRGFLCHYVDLDPRWVRKCITNGWQDLFRRYIDHLIDQVRDVLTTQDIEVMSCTPPILENLATRPDVYDLIRDKIRGILWGGTSMGAETLRLFEEELFPGATVAGAYGNTMMGIAPQRPQRPGDPARCIFRPFYPYTVVEVVDPTEPASLVSDNSAGRVKITTLTRELFMPPTLERDTATRRVAVDGYPGIELSDVKPREQESTIIEGVY